MVANEENLAVTVSSSRVHKSSVISRRSRALPLIAAAGVAALVLSACGSSAGGGAEADSGFDFGASQDEVEALLENNDPITLTYQPAAASPNSLMAPAALQYKDYIEERSGGKISVEIVWGQGIAGYSELFDALEDGRVDVAWTLPIYEPTDFPVYDAMSKAMVGLPMSPYAGEAIYNAVATELAWNSEELLEEYTAKGLVPLHPMTSSGAYYGSCNAPVESEEDWSGQQIRIASTAHLDVMEAIGATPVSLEYVETYEGLQRGTVDCTLGVLPVAAEGGTAEVAPHLTYPSDEASLSRSVAAHIGGSSINSMPLVYQQIIFDATTAVFSGSNEVIIEGNAQGISEAKDNDGTVSRFGDEIEQAIIERQAAHASDAVDTGLIPDDFDTQLQESLEKWTDVAEDLELSDGGALEDMDEWYDAETTDLRPMGDRVVEELLLPHRPE